MTFPTVGCKKRPPTHCIVVRRKVFKVRLLATCVACRRSVWLKRLPRNVPIFGFWYCFSLMATLKNLFCMFAA